MRLLRIADIVNHRRGGMSRWMHLMSDELRLMGHEVDQAFTEELNARGPAMRPRRVTMPFRALTYVRERLRAGERYDVVEMHEPLAAPYALARRIDRSLPPMLLMSHGLEHRGQILRVQYMEQKGLPVSLRARYAHYSVIGQADVGLRLAEQVALSTTEDRDFLVEHLGLKPDHVTIVNGGVTDVFLSAPAPNPDARGVLFLASWIQRKGIPDLVPAMARILESHPDLTFTVAGTDTEETEIRDAFPERVRARVTRRPRVGPETDLLALYREHAVFVVPSVFEGQFLAMLEAAAAGLPIVATNRCGMKDFVREGATGRLVPIADPDALGNAIAELVDNPERRKKMAVEAQRDARAYTWARSAAQYNDAMHAAVAHGAR